MSESPGAGCCGPAGAGAPRSWFWLWRHQGGPNGDGKTGAYTGSNSECAFSGLEDGSEPGTVAGPGNVQNWGHIPKEDREFLTSLGVSPGTACNGHL